MDTLLLGSPPSATVELLRAAPWMDEAGRRTDQFELFDEAILGTIRLLIVMTAADASARWFVPVPVDAPGLPADRTTAYHRLITEALRDGLRLRTQRGNLIEFRGAPAEFRARLPFDPGWCSNALSLLDLGGSAHAHKTYRRIGIGTREPELLRVMADSGRTQQPIGDYTYVDTSTGRRDPLGVVYRYAEGDGLYVPLQAGVRALWPLLRAGAEPEAAVAESQRALRAPLRATGRFLRAFHQDLAERLGPCPDFPAEGFLAETLRQTAALRPRILADTRFPATVRQAAVTGIERELERVAALPSRPWPTGPCHGDLHLSHVLRHERADTSWRLCVIDLSTPCLDPADTGTAQSPWQDLAALRRGLEIFTADEFADQAASFLDMDPDDTCRMALLLAADAAPDTPGWTPGRLAALDRMRAAGRLWAARASRLLTEEAETADAEDTVPSPRLPVPDDDHPAWRLFRLRRLLHELDYAYAHDRAYHAAINLRHAVEAAGLPVAAAKD
ncbi:phosphotransferase [Streptomyces sp. NPDC058092]|uniref:phosphotransferase n=1 Tax=Streptomyces sp. NPDC058092 TaxID=3346336 RepID=UPI0036E139EB